ncbi:hypothetical protein FEF65_11735 [Mariprofundus erugo]|uniref:Nucleoside-binding protein n=2 Tax=Mariprofundus erugo TaxID=2528639 RepID=A0A5R9GRW8_9PROT|nr:hypothetical protein FEF65_11735 [Mariprofundus erugo]
MAGRMSIGYGAGVRRLVQVAGHFPGRWWRQIICLWLCCLASQPLLAEQFSSTNVQLLYGNHFHDPYYGSNTSGGGMTTVTVEHFGTWAYGDNFLFVDFKSGNFVDFAARPTGKTTRMYGEWHPRLSLSALTGHDLQAGIISDLFIAGQINRDGEGFKADMAGLGINLILPGFKFFEVDGYARKDNFNRMTWQVTTAWSLPLYRDLLVLNGYIDANGSDNNGVEVNGQPQLLFDPVRFLGHGQNSENGSAMQVGVEWAFHRHRLVHSSVLQAMLKWTF